MFEYFGKNNEYMKTNKQSVMKVQEAIDICLLAFYNIPFQALWIYFGNENCKI